MILHETPGSRYSLVPGDEISTGTKIRYFTLGRYGTMRIDQTVKKYDIQKNTGLCTEYDSEDSVEKCNLQKVILKNIEEMFAGVPDQNVAA
jgi:hypothetical protein